jgi:hypothetical protein
MNEILMLKKLGVLKTELIELIEKTLNESIQSFSYNNGVIEINNGKPWLSIPTKVEFFEELSNKKSIHFGLPIVDSATKSDTAIGGKITVRVNTHNSNEKVRSGRFRNSIEISNKNDWRVGHILFSWLVDRYFKGCSFYPEEKNLMYFQQSIHSNESVLKKKKDMRNHCYYETQLREYLTNHVDFDAFTYSVHLIYYKDKKIPIGTVLQLATFKEDKGNLITNEMKRFNVFAPNLVFTPSELQNW